MAGQVKEKYAPNVEVEVVYEGMPGSEDAPEPPNLAVDDEALGSKVTFEELKEIILEKLETQ